MKRLNEVLTRRWVGVILFVAFMIFIYKLDIYNKWWVSFVLIIGLLAKFGCELNILQLAVGIGITKALKDLFSR